MVATGYPHEFEYGKGEQPTEIIGRKNCKIEPFPMFGLEGANGGLYRGRVPFVCGGYFDVPPTWEQRGYRQVTGECHYLNQNGSWVKEERYEDFESAMGYGRFDSMFPRCMLSWNSTSISYLTMDWPRTWIYNVDLTTNQRVRVEGPYSLVERTKHSCQEMEIDGKPYIIVAGGHNENGFVRSTEILDLNDFEKGWQPAGDLPLHGLEGHQMVASKDKKSVFAIGGQQVYQLGTNSFTWSNDPREIYKFTCTGELSTCQWSKLDYELMWRNGRSNFVAIPIPDDLADKLCQ